MSNDAMLITYKVTINDRIFPYQVELKLDSDTLKNADEKGPNFLSDRRFIIRQFRDEVRKEYGRELLTVKWETLDFIEKRVHPRHFRSGH